MKKTIIIKAILFIIILFSGNVWGQLPMTIYYMENIPQSSLINPAMAPRANTFVGIPLMNSYTSFKSNVELGDFIQVPSDGIPLTLYHEDFDYNQLYAKVGESLTMEFTEYNSPIMFGFRLNRNYITFGFSEKIRTTFGIPSDLLKFGDVGIPDNTSLDFSEFDMNAYYYREFLIGFSREITDKLTVGAHVKPLFGKAAINTDIESFSIDASKEIYSIKASGTIYSSLPIESITYDEDGFPEDINMQDMSMKDYVDKYGTSFSNPGLAFDLGAVYNLDERWSFSAAINDLGFLNYKTDLHSLSFSGDYDYEGPEITPGNSEGELIRDDILESLKDSINFSDGNSKFSMRLTPIIYAGSSYRVNHVFTVGFLSRSAFQKNNFKQNFNFSANLNLYNQFTTTVNYMLDIKGSNHLGFGLSYALGPLQMYFLVQNIPTSYRNYKIDGNKIPIPDNLKEGSFLFGLNLIFGGKEFRDKPMISLKN